MATKTPLILLAALSALTTFTRAQSPTFDTARQVGTLQSAALPEVSGLAASRLNAGVLWVHNDSGDSARVFAMNTSGTLLGTYTLGGASATDWEDMAVGPGPQAGYTYLYVGDTGDNGLARTSLTIYRVPEPPVSGSSGPATVTLTSVEALKVQYPNGGRYDCETLLVDPIFGDIFLVTRDRGALPGTGTSYVFKYAAPQSAAVTATLQLVARIDGSGEIKAGDVSKAGDLVILRPHSANQQLDGWIWSRSVTKPLESIFANPPSAVPVPLAAEPQGEAVGFAADGSGYFTTSEGTFQPIYWYEKQVTVTDVPLAPTAVTTAIGDSQIALTWSLSPTATSYLVKRATIFGEPYQPIATVTATKFTDSTIADGVTYYYVISAENPVGESSDSEPVSAVTGKPAAPTSLSASAVSKTQIQLNWADNSGNEDGFYVERSTDARRYKQISTTAVNATSLLDSNVQGGKTYYYRLRAFNGVGTSAYSNTASAKTPR